MKKITHKEYLDYQMSMIVARLRVIPLQEFKGLEKLAKNAVDLFLKHNCTEVSDENCDIKKDLEEIRNELKKFDLHSLYKTNNECDMGPF